MNKWLPWLAGALGLAVLARSSSAAAAAPKNGTTPKAPSPRQTGLELDFLLPESGRQSFKHSFSEGESVPMLAEMYYGSAQWWPLISAANFNLILGDPSWSKPGTPLVIWRNESITQAEFDAAAKYAQTVSVAV